MQKITDTLKIFKSSIEINFYRLDYVIRFDMCIPNKKKSQTNISGISSVMAIRDFRTEEIVRLSKKIQKGTKINYLPKNLPRS